MKLLAKRSLAWMLSLLMCISLLSGLVLTTSADSTVNYVYSGKYIYNWGDRDTVATFLSPNAIEFYEDNNVTYEQLAAYAGSSNTSSVPSSNLYKQLQTLMKNNHSHETSYDETRNQFRYTDCQNNGSPTSISVPSGILSHLGYASKAFSSHSYPSSFFPQPNKAHAVRKLVLA